MKYPYIVNMGGKWYQAGTDVPACSTSENPILEKATEEVAKTEYKKTDINRMSTSELQEIAKGIGIEDAENKSGNQLKKELIDFYKL